MDFKELLRLLRRRWKAIAGFVVIGVVIAAAYSFLASPVYQSKAQVFISTDAPDTAQALYASAFGAARVQSYADLATSGELLNRVISKLDLDLTQSELADKIDSSVRDGTVIIDLTVSDGDPRVAQQIAETEAKQLTIYLANVETPAGSATAPMKATVVDKASFNGDPVSPHKLLNIVIGVILGLLVGCAVGVIRDLLDTTVKSSEDVDAATSAPVMARITFDPSFPKTPLLTEMGNRSARTEAFRLLRTSLQFLDVDANPKSLVITSAIPGEGKTSTASNLAIALAQTGKKVLLVDGDLRRPQLADLLGLESAVGLTTVLVGRSDLEASIQRHDGSGVHVLASGPIPPNPTEILQSRAVRDLIHDLRQRFDAVIIDAPPLLPVADAAVMATSADGAILVVRHGRTTREQLRHASDRLAQVSARLFGVAINMSPRRIPKGDYDYGYGYGYGYYAPDDAST